MEEEPHAQHHRRQICKSCDRPNPICLCHVIPTDPIPTNTEIIILHHPHESRHKLNTTPLLTKSLQNVTTIPTRRLRRLHISAEGESSLPSPQTIYLFPPSPSSPAVTISEFKSLNLLNHGEISNPPPLRLIVFDATWKHAKEMVKASEEVLREAGAVRVCLDTGIDASVSGGTIYDSELVLRKEPFGGCVTTAEAVARCLGAIEPDGEEIERKLISVLKEMELLAANAPIVEIPPPPAQAVGIADPAAEIAGPQQQEIARARNAAAAQVARFEAEQNDAIPRVPAGPNYATLICGPAATMPFTRCTYPDISTFIPNFTTAFYYLNSMDHLMTATKRWTDNCQGWVPPYSQIYIGMLCYIQTMQAMQAAGLLTPTSEITNLLSEFTRRFPLGNLWIPGPLVSLFKSIACFKPSASDIFGNVSPTLPASPGWSRARRFRITDAASTHLPNINIFISRINSVCAAASRPNATSDSFLRDINGPRYMATLFAQPCNHDANELANLVSPGSSMAYSGNLKLWQNAADQLLFVNPPALLDVGATNVADDWTSFLGLSSSSNWFGSVSAMMVKYCQFWKGSVPLYDCSPASSAAGSVRCIATNTDVYTPPVWNAQRGNHTTFVHDDANQSSHYTMRPNFHLTIKAATSLEDIPLAHYYSALTYNINMATSEDSLAALTHGEFWNVIPDCYVRSGIQIYPGINASLARDYHSETRIESERQNV